MTEKASTRELKIPIWAKVIILPIWAVGVMLLTQLLIGAIFRWIIPTHIINAPWVQSLYIALSDIIALFVIIFVPYKLTKLRSTRKDLGLLELLTWNDILIAPIGYIIYMLLSSLLFRIFSVFPWFDAGQSQNLGYSSLSLLFGAERIFTLVVLLVLVPVVEEIIFRGFLYGHLKSWLQVKYKKKAEIVAIILATLIVSLVFGIMHGQWNVGVDVFAMSVVLCISREITGSIYPGILIHIIKNTLAFFVLVTMLY